jgi:hypothetical protein
MDEICAELGIQQQFTERYTPNQNGAAERANRNILDMARAMMSHVRAPLSWWPDACHTSAYLHNRLLTTGGDSYLCPHELATGERVCYKNLHVWGCRVFVFLPKAVRTHKLSARSVTGRFLGYNFDGSYRVMLNDETVIHTKEIIRWVEDDITIESGADGVGDLFEQVSVHVEPEVTAELVSPVSNGTPSEPGTQTESVADEDGGLFEQVSVHVEPEVTAELVSPMPTVTPSEPVAPCVSVTPSMPEVAVLHNHRQTRFAHERRGPLKNKNRRDRKKAAMLVRDHQIVKGMAALTPMYPSWKSEKALQLVRWGDVVPSFVATLGVPVAIPASVLEALTGPDSLQWMAAMDRELASLRSHETWRAVGKEELSSEVNLIGSRWVYDVKVNSCGEVIRYKARLVAQGFTQVEGVDYSETYAPVANKTSLRIMVSIAAMYDMDLHQMDVDTAFLNAKLPEDQRVFMKLPSMPGCSEREVVQILQCLYGLKQAPREWNLLVNEFILSLGYRRSVMDSCVYTKGTPGEDDYSFIVLYVDDLLMGTMNMRDMSKLKGSFNDRFSMKDLGELEYCLGLRFTRDRGAKTIKIDQSRYILSVLEHFGMMECYTVSTPGAPGTYLSTGEEEPMENDVPYREAIGCLTYISMCTRPDISYAVNQCARFMEAPKMSHWNGVLRIMRYLKGTCDEGILFGNMISHKDKFGEAGYNLLPKDVELEKCLLGFSDASHAGCPVTRRSATGYIFFLNGPISWGSKMQTTVAQSPCEAEYMSLSAAGSESRWISQLLNELGPGVCTKVVVCEDNTSAIALAKHDRITPRSKHIDIKYHVLQEWIREGKLEVMRVSTKLMCADVFTKNVGTNLLRNHRSIIMGC